MKRKILIGSGILVGILLLIFILMVPAAPLLISLGVKPICIQGDISNLRIVDCPQAMLPTQVFTPLPLPTAEEQVPTPLIFDDDGSPDGMIALLFFLRNPLYNVVAITISPGEAHPGLFTPHVARLLAAVGKSGIPIGVGREKPLEGNNSFPEPWRQSSDVFWSVSLPQTSASPEPQPAASLIVDTLRKSTRPVTVFVSGPHTNLAEALRLDSRIREKISSINIMGGSIYIPGNIESDWPEIHNQVAEWNIWVDPVAAHEVFASGIPLYLMPLDGTNKVIWNQSDIATWSSSKTAAGMLAAEILKTMLSIEPTGNTYIWDLATAVALTDSRICPLDPLALDVTLEAGAEQGRTIVKEAPPNTQVCLEPDAGQIKARVTSILAN